VGLKLKAGGRLALPHLTGVAKVGTALVRGLYELTVRLTFGFDAFLQCWWFQKLVLDF